MLTTVMKVLLDESRTDLEKQFSQFFDKIIQVRSVFRQALSVLPSDHKLALLHMHIHVYALGISDTHTCA